MEQWIREIKVFFDKKKLEIYQLPGTEPEIESFFLDPESLWVKSKTPMPLRVVLITQSVSQAAILSLLANSHVQSFANLAGARFKTQEKLGSKPPDSARNIKAASSKRKTTIFTRKWCFVALDEVHEYRGEKSRQFVGAVAISKCALAMAGVSATPVMSNAKVCSPCGLPGLPSHHWSII